MKNQFIVIKTTYPEESQAKAAATRLINAKIVACVQINKVESFFNWHDKVVNELEFLLSIKTTSLNFEAIKSLIERDHPYKIPQIFSQKIEQISDQYAKWIEDQIL